MKLRTFLMVAAIIGVIAYLIFGPIGRQFGRDARVKVRFSEPEPTASETERPAMADATLMSPVQPPVAAPSISGEVREPRPIERRTIQFDGGATSLTSTEVAILEEVATQYRNRSIRSITLIVDRSGGSDIADARIETVRRQLIKDGVAEFVIESVEGKQIAQDSIIVAVHRHVSDADDAVAASPPP